MKKLHGIFVRDQFKFFFGKIEMIEKTDILTLCSPWSITSEQNLVGAVLMDDRLHRWA